MGKSMSCKINGSHKWVWSDITKNELTCEKCGKKSKEQWKISVMKAMNKTAERLLTVTGTQTADSNTEDYLYVSTPMSNVAPPSSNKSLNGSSATYMIVMACYLLLARKNPKA